MEKMIHKKVLERKSRMSYRNFNVSVYCPVGNINQIEDFEAFDEKLRHLYSNVKLGHAYLECYRGTEWIEKEQLLKVKAFFESKGIATSGGITTCDGEKQDGFASLCYSDEKGQDTLRRAVALNAEVFDEFIFDDFYFLNCRCAKCVKEKGTRSWSEFRLAQKKYITEEIVMKTAKEINPDINVIIKYPQWYEDYNETGYDLVMEPKQFDTIYTGTETRNPTYSQQHLPKYISYFIMRYLESAAPGRNLGGWFDPYECSYNITSYLEQGYLTLLGKAKEVTLFCMDSLIKDPAFLSFAPALGQMFAEMDDWLSQLGNPIGVAAYRPGNARGENNVHNYLGMCGIPFEPYIEYPAGEKVIFLSEGAASDKDIVKKMQDSMLEGAEVIVTSGFVRKLGDAFKEFVNVSYSARKALVNEYAISRDKGVCVTGRYMGDKNVLIPQMDYCTNDIWELAAAYGTDNNFPILLRCSYGEGSLGILTIPDNMGELYHYPAQVLWTVRELFCKEMPAILEGPSKVQMFVYDNDMVVIRSDLNYYETVSLQLKSDYTKVTELLYGNDLPVVGGKVSMQLTPGVNYYFKLER